MAQQQKIDRNVSVVVGRVRVEPVERPAAHDCVLVTFDVTSEVDGLRTTTPVSWMGRADRRPRLRAGSMVGVVGVIDRRFVRVGGRSVGIVELQARAIARTRSSIDELVAAALGAPTTGR
jgi:hypothetical protein